MDGQSARTWVYETAQGRWRLFLSRCHCHNAWPIHWRGAPHIAFHYNPDMRKSALRIGTCLTLLLGSIVALAMQPPTSPTQPTAPSPQVAPAPTNPGTMRLARITEVRRRFAPGVSLQTAPYFEGGGPPTGNWLMCDLLIDGQPQTSRVMRVTTVSESASDDLGTDLIKSIQTRIDNDPIVQMRREIVLEGRGPAMRWYVAAPARSASTFDATLYVRVDVSAWRDDITLNPTKDWQRLEHPSINHLNVEYRWKKVGGESAYLEMRPPAVVEYVYFVAPQPFALRFGRPRFSASDSSSGSFLLDRDAAEGAEVRLQLHADITSLEAVLTLDDEPLP